MRRNGSRCGRIDSMTSRPNGTAGRLHGASLLAGPAANAAPDADDGAARVARGVPGDGANARRRTVHGMRTIPARFASAGALAVDTKVSTAGSLTSMRRASPGRIRTCGATVSETNGTPYEIAPELVRAPRRSPRSRRLEASRRPRAVPDEALVPGEEAPEQRARHPAAVALDRESGHRRRGEREGHASGCPSGRRRSARTRRARPRRLPAFG